MTILSEHHVKPSDVSSYPWTHGSPSDQELKKIKNQNEALRQLGRTYGTKEIHNYWSKKGGGYSSYVQKVEEKWNKARENSPRFKNEATTDHGPQRDRGNRPISSPSSVQQLPECVPGSQKEAELKKRQFIIDVMPPYLKKESKRYIDQSPQNSDDDTLYSTTSSSEEELNKKETDLYYPTSTDLHQTLPPFEKTRKAQSYMYKERMRSPAWHKHRLPNIKKLIPSRCRDDQQYKEASLFVLSDILRRKSMKDSFSYSTDRLDLKRKQTRLESKDSSDEKWNFVGAGAMNTKSSESALDNLEISKTSANIPRSPPTVHIKPVFSKTSIDSKKSDVIEAVPDLKSLLRKNLIMRRTTNFLGERPQLDTVKIAEATMATGISAEVKLRLLREYMRLRKWYPKEHQEMDKYFELINYWTAMTKEENSNEISGGDERKQWHDDKEKELFADIINYIKTKNKSGEFHPYVVLHTAYLRITKAHVKRLENMCRDLGREPGIHYHSEEVDIHSDEDDGSNTSMQGKVDTMDVPSRSLRHRKFDKGSNISNRSMKSTSSTDTMSWNYGRLW